MASSISIKRLLLEPSESTSSTTTMTNMHPKKSQNSHASSSSTSKSKGSEFGAEAHEVPSGPNPISTENPKPKPQAEPNTNGDATHNNNSKEGGNNNIAAETYTFRELATATKNFRQECLIGEGGFGRVYKGKLEKINQVVAVKQLDRNGLQGNREFLNFHQSKSHWTVLENENSIRHNLCSRIQIDPELADPLLRGEFPVRVLIKQLQGCHVSTRGSRSSAIDERCR
ncbi:hypothetical protein GH714_025972 [Hevea brasiliensis]|uniref:Protein kinase domain-containing protein n=1 Tax=Hevea brasiliensis TaxID=3981 RepID=A0A6A6KX51_HEVBR|nr:hypothetical protein GH714_025972 [Hevea brasiliensis]